MAKFTAKLDRFILIGKDITDEFPVNIAEYSFPFQDGSALENMGNDARVVRFEANFRRETYDDHYDFLTLATSGLIYEFVHPVYGPMNGRVKSPTVTTKAGENDWVVIRFVFVQELIGLETEPDIDIVSSSETAYTDGQDQNMQSYESAAVATMPLDGKEVMSTDLDPDKSIVEQILNISTLTRRKMADLDRMIGVLDLWESNIITPIDSIVNLIDYGTKLPGRVIGSCARVAERVSTLKRTTEGFPSTFVTSLTNNISGLKQSLKIVSKEDSTYDSVVQSLDIAAAQSAGVHTSYLYSDDEELQGEFEKNINLNSFDGLGNRILTVDNPDLLNQNELENSLYLVRELLDIAFQYNREFLQANKEMALSLYKHVSNVKLTRDLIFEIDLKNNIIPVHVLCNQYGLSHRYIDKIININNIENPTFVTGKVNMYARPW